MPTTVSSRLKTLAMSVIMLAGMITVAGPATAQATIAAANTEVYFGYTFDGTDATAAQLLPNIGSMTQYGTVPGQASRIHTDWTSTVSQDGDFYFLSDVQCIGTCSMTILTRTSLTLANTTDQDASMRVDSLILPGHLGIQGNANVSGEYQFTASAGVEYGLTYNADDQRGFNGDNYSQGNGDSYYYDYQQDNVSYNPLNSKTEYLQGYENAVDFGATDLNLPITVGANSQVILIYTSTLTVASHDICTDLAICSGAQVVFGDPRNNGGGTTRRGIADAFDAGLPESVIGRQFGAYNTSYDLVPGSAPLPPDQPPVSAPNYVPGPYANGEPSPSPVPEPSAWLLMIAGIGVIGAAARRRRIAARA